MNRRLLSLLALAGVMALTACSAIQLGYNNADTMIHWRASRYFDFEGDAKAEFDRRVQRFLGWHRKTELPRYADLANELASRLERGVSQADLVWGYDSVQTHLRQSIRAGAAEMGDLLDALTPAQIERFQERLEKENSEYARKYGLREAPEERRAKRVKRNIERMEDWYGTLSDAQVERIAAYTKRAPLDDQMRDRERRRLQRELVAMLKAKEARKRLVEWAVAWDQNRDPAYESLRNANLQEYYGMLIDLDKTLTPEQRGRAVKRLRGFAADFRALAAAAESPRPPLK